MSVSKVSTSREFVADFELVAEHYKLRELGEYDLAKDAARRDMENAINTFSELAKEIRSQ